MNKWWSKFIFFLLRQYTSIGGQAVMEGVMMRSPHAFVVAVRRPDGKIVLRRDQWFGVQKKFPFLARPFLRGAVMVFEAMANGIVALNFSANVVEENKKKKTEKIDWTTFITILTSVAFGLLLFVFLPHYITTLLAKLFDASWDLDSLTFHLVDGGIKALFFVSYIFIIGQLPDIRRVFQYHGAEHKSIYTFEHDEDLNIANAKKHTTLHPRCGTSFVFFLIFISIILFSVIFSLYPVGAGLPPMLRHLAAILFKMFLMLPIAGISYEIIRYSGKHPHNPICKFFTTPGLLLQRLTTKEPDEKQLEIGLASIKAALYLEEKYGLKNAEARIITRDEVVIDSLEDMEQTKSKLKEFLEV